MYIKKTSDCSGHVYDLLLKGLSSYEAPTASLAKACTLLKRDFLRKMAGGNAERRTITTLEAWRRSEAYCFNTNQRLNQINDFDPLAVFLTTVRSKVEAVIGISPPKGVVV